MKIWNIQANECNQKLFVTVVALLAHPTTHSTYKVNIDKINMWAFGICMWEMDCIPYGWMRRWNVEIFSTNVIFSLFTLCTLNCYHFHTNAMHTFCHWDFVLLFCVLNIYSLWLFLPHSLLIPPSPPFSSLNRFTLKCYSRAASVRVGRVCYNNYGFILW